ncbi:helix-turn-helix domain-containing protein [Amycolatopsis aidingensis]|uniref:helix-turn-helix domain-containing protein n=1 Tax=Amycolatopsis aidingensis TaxID=2842453 RepID=UPI001C0CE8C9|nr:helix-turn-helix domain-containing protein [Amycolatopsis aidingensis]
MSTRELLAEPEQVRRALSPLRRRLLARLRTPASAAELAAELELPRQRIGYHLRLLEEAGLVELAEERQRRGFVERVLRATADAFLVDPAVLGGTEEQRAGDRHAAEHLLDVAAGAVRDVARMQAAAERAGRRLLTFTVETEVRFAAPGDVHPFTEALAGAIAEVVAEFDTPGGRPYRLLGAGHPAARQEDSDDRRQ